MDGQRTSAPDNTNRNKIIFILASIYLIGSLLWRAVMPAHEYPLRTERVLTVALDLGVILGLFALKPQLTTLRALFWIALAAGIGLFAIRLNGDASWWTGHLMYQLPPR
jgi:hypothetical protein